MRTSILFRGRDCRQIVAADGVSRRSFFRFFEAKEEAPLADYPELSKRVSLWLGVGSGYR